jgi:hypothetical protein
MYREYLDPSWRAEFDAWRGAYRNPSKKLLGNKKTKNWDSAERRADLESDGVVAEVIFPNTVPPFYDKAYHVSPLAKPEQYQRWLAGTRAHNRWLADFCAEEPQRRAGIGLIHLNDRRRRDRRREVDRRSTACAAECFCRCPHSTTCTSSSSARRPTTGCGRRSRITGS